MAQQRSILKSLASIGVSSQKITSMLMQVSTAVSHFLDNLSYLYESNGINFQIKNYHSTLMRMLSPFQLLSMFGVEDNKKMFLKISKNKNDKNESKKVNHEQQTQKWWKNEEIDDQFPFDKKFVQKDNNLNTVTIFKDNNLSNSISERLQPIVKEVPQKKRTSSQFTKTGRQPVLGVKVEHDLCRWIQNRYDEQKQITPNDIISQARMMTNSKNFQGSRGWLKRFMARFPAMQKLTRMSQSHQRNELQKFDGKLNIYSGLENFSQKFVIENQQFDKESWYRADDGTQKQPKIEQYSKLEEGSVSNQQYVSHNEVENEQINNPKQEIVLRNNHRFEPEDQTVWQGKSYSQDQSI